MDGAGIRAVLAGNIKTFRKRRNWSQANLAEKSGLSIVYLSDIERGNKWPYLDSLVKLSDALEVEVYELLKPEEKPLPEKRKIIYRFSADVNAMVSKSMKLMEERLKRSMKELQKEHTEN